MLFKKNTHTHFLFSAAHNRTEHFKNVALWNSGAANKKNTKFSLLLPKRRKSKLRHYHVTHADSSGHYCNITADTMAVLSDTSNNRMKA